MSSKSRISFPSTARRRSPSWIPAFHAGEPTWTAPATGAASGTPMLKATMNRMTPVIAFITTPAE